MRSSHRISIKFLLLVSVLVLPAQSARTQDVLHVCANDIQTFCSQVTPGNGRLLACFYAHEDKISDACDLAISEAADQLDWFLHTLQVAIETCVPDIEKHCSGVAVGQGRIYRCLKGKKQELNDECAVVVDTVTTRLTE